MATKLQAMPLPLPFPGLGGAGSVALAAEANVWCTEVTRKGRENMADKGRQFLRLSFLIGGVADALVAVNWFLIASGVAMPNIMSGFVAVGGEYRFAMYIAALFMTGWSAILFWGWFEPIARRGLLLITALMLLLSIVLELIFYQSILGGSGFVIGIGARVAVIVKFSASYFYSRSGTGGLLSPNDGS